MMNNLKKYVKPLLCLMTSLIVNVLAMALFHYMGVFKLASIGKINFVVMAILMFVEGLVMGKKTSKKGYLEGLKLGGFVVVSLFLLNIIFTRHFDLYVVLYYVVMMVSSVIGSMIGINLHR